jgi:hypothetical protein
VTLSAMWVTACIQFLLARRLGGERLRKRLGDQLGRIGLLLERRGALAVAGARLLPGPFSGEHGDTTDISGLRRRHLSRLRAEGCWVERSGRGAGLKRRRDPEQPNEHLL